LHKFLYWLISSNFLFHCHILEGLGDFKIGGQIIHTEKYAADLVLLAKEEKVLQDMIDELIEIGRCCGMEMNVGEKK
jgi:hypothetical protein